MKIIEKVRSISKYNEDMKGVVDKPAIIKLVERDGKFVLRSIEFEFYDTVLVRPTGIIFLPEHGPRKILIEYCSWEELLEM